jgi:DNA topoisomerase IB
METYVINGRSISIFGSSNGEMNDKFNRAAVLLSKFETIDIRLKNILTKEKESTESFKCALGTLLLLHTGIRVGNEDSADGYMTQPHPNQKDAVSKFVQTYGLTTLQNRHFIRQQDNTYLLDFIGKKQVKNTFKVNDTVLCTAIDKLLQSNQTETTLGINDYTLTKYIKANIGEQFSPKDFRTATANKLAWQFITSINPMFKVKRHLKPQINLLFTFVSSKLNNLPGTAKKNYVAPEIIGYLSTMFNN